MLDYGPDPKHTIDILDQLVKLGLLSEAEFRQMHHLGGSISSFRSYCKTVKSFRPNSGNRRVHEELQRILDSHQKDTAKA